jgi:hypothetical protein
MESVVMGGDEGPGEATGVSSETVRTPLAGAWKAASAPAGAAFIFDSAAVAFVVGKPDSVSLDGDETMTSPVLDSNRVTSDNCRWRPPTSSQGIQILYDGPSLESL